MRKFILSVWLLSTAVIASSQLTSNSGKMYINFSGIDYLFVFNGITPSTDITYTGQGTSINWYKFSSPTISISNQSYISPEDATGYILNVEGKEKHIWVIDYQKYLPVLNSIEPENNPSGQCEQVKLNIDAAVPNMSYTTSDGNSHDIPRIFTFKYQTLTWNNTEWKQNDTIQSVTLPLTQKSVPALFCSTTFTLSGDQFAEDLGLTPKSISSSEYTPAAVICHITTNVTSRNHLKNNEAEAPSTTTPINFSAPIDVQFLSNANEPATQFYDWNIYKNGTSIVNRKDKYHRYTFTESGNYNVTLKVSNSTCSYSDSVTVTVSESAIYVPNVFTPNGDGINDEFRVAYKSIISFQCWVFNRWGRQVYMWTDPTKGWNGKINGKDAVPGAYFYVIKALGSDYNPNSTPDSKTHRRIGEYILKGDINLLRGEN
jgi:gliding motility-associated-like protein